MVKKVQTLYESATGNLRVVNRGNIVECIVDGNGSMVTSITEFVQAQKWAQAKFSGGNSVQDRNRFLEQITALISRPGSFVSTRGSGKLLEDIARAMKSTGYELRDWQLPPELKNIGGKPPPETKKAAADTAAEPAQTDTPKEST